MYRYKDRKIKSRRNKKKYNPNKEKNHHSQGGYQQIKMNRTMRYGWVKGVQQVLIAKHGVRIHKKEMSFMDVLGPCPAKAVGNTTYKTMYELSKGIDVCTEFPQEARIVHDMTRWKKSKKRTKQRKAERHFKANAQAMY